MEKKIYEALAKAGDRYWWNRGRQYLVDCFIRAYAPSALGRQKQLKILDIGCAAGGTLFSLAKWGDVWGLDISAEAIALCRTWGIAQDRLVQGDAEQMTEFEDKTFDLVTAVEILEHLEHPERALREAWRILKPGGLFIISVPADMRLWSDRDRRLAHRTRYTVQELRGHVRQEGFIVLKASCANAFYYWPYRFILWMRRLKGERVPVIKTDTYTPGAWLSALFTTILRLETWLILLGGLPWGVSAVCAARKPIAYQNDDRPHY